MRITALSVVFVSMGSAATAGAIDRSGQPLTVLFKDGNYAEFSVTHTNPSLGGKDLPQSPPAFPFPYDSGMSYDDVADDWFSYGFGFKYDINERFSIAVIGAEDYGSDIVYPDEPGSLLGGTEAIADTYAVSVFGRYKFDDNWSVHAGLRRDTAEGNIKLNGLAYGEVAGYEVELDQDAAYGYAIGGAYERPEIALRIALTYYSPIEHEFGTSESLGGVPLGSSEDTKVKTPEAVNLEFQTGVAPDTLVFGGIRWARWSQFKIEPEIFESLAGVGLVDLEDTTTYTLGVGHRFNERFSGSAALIYEAPGDDLVSPLSPTTGLTAIALGAAYRVDQIEISGGVRYTWLGDAKAETGTPDRARADFSDNDALSVGLKVGYYF